MMGTGSTMSVVHTKILTESTLLFALPNPRQSPAILGCEKGET